MKRFKSYINEKITDAEDSGKFGKSLEKAFARCMELAGLDYEENGLQGKGGALWDFKPKGLNWKGLPEGAPVNLKTVTARTLFTSTDFWQKVFGRDFSEEDEARVERIIKQHLGKIGFPDVWWLKPKSRAIGKAVKEAAMNDDAAAAEELMSEKNWSYHKLGSYDLDWELEENGTLHIIRVYKGGEKFASIRVRVNKAAGNTAGWARTTSGKPEKPFRRLKG